MFELIVGGAILVVCYLWLTTKKNESKEVATTLGCVNGCLQTILFGFVVLVLCVVFNMVFSSSASASSVLDSVRVSSSAVRKPAYVKSVDSYVDPVDSFTYIKICLDFDKIDLSSTYPVFLFRDTCASLLQQMQPKFESGEYSFDRIIIEVYGGLQNSPSSSSDVYTMRAAFDWSDCRHLDFNNFQSTSASDIAYEWYVSDSFALSDLRAEQKNADSKAIALSEYESDYPPIDYKALARNPELFDGQKATICGEILQVLGTRKKGYTLRVYVDGDYDQIILMAVSPDNVPSYNLLEGDMIIARGTLAGEYTYETILGAEITLPLLVGHHIDLDDE